MLRQYKFAIDLTKLGQLNYVHGSVLPHLLREFPLSTLVSQFVPLSPTGMLLAIYSTVQVSPFLYSYLKFTASLN